MSAATLPTPAPAAPPKPRPSLVAAVEVMRAMGPGELILFDGLTWDEYVWFDRRRDELGSGVRLTYSDHRLELMTTSFVHDSSSVRLSLFVTTVLGAFRIPHRGARRTTYRREDVERGFEPDESFYIQNVAAVRGVREIDLTRHPPPDLVIEIDHTRTSLPKQPIFAALGVPEVWRFDGAVVTFLVLQPGGGFQLQPTSRAFPMVSSTDVTRLLLVEPDDDTAYTEAVRAWAAALVPPQP